MKAWFERNWGSVIFFGAPMAGLAWFIVLPSMSRFLVVTAGTSDPAVIQGMETALAKLHTDPSRDDLRALFKADAFSRKCEELVVRSNLNAFEASTEIYTVTVAALLRHGRNAVKTLSASEGTKDLAEVINEEPLMMLATSYMEVESDAWGTPFHFFVGPWPKEWGPMVFRSYEADDENDSGDALTVDVVKDGKTVKRLGFPPVASKAVYIWSFGPNKVSDQAVLDPSGKYAPPASRHYRAGAPVEYISGGNDINNWDRNQSWRSLHKTIPPYRVLWDYLR